MKRSEGPVPTRAVPPIEGEFFFVDHDAEPWALIRRATSVVVI